MGNPWRGPSRRARAASWGASGHDRYLRVALSKICFRCEHDLPPHDASHLRAAPATGSSARAHDGMRAHGYVGQRSRGAGERAGERVPLSTILGESLEARSAAGESCSGRLKEWAGSVRTFRFTGGTHHMRRAPCRSARRQLSARCPMALADGAQQPLRCACGRTGSQRRRTGVCDSTMLEYDK